MATNTVIDNRALYPVYRSNKLYAILITIIFSLFALISAFLSMLGLSLISSLTPTDSNKLHDVTPDLTNLVSAYDMLNLLTAALYILGAIFFLLWVNRASKNAHYLQPTHKFEFTSGWAVGAYFIPLLNFYWGYKVIKEIRTQSMPDEKITSTKLALLFWWIPFILHNILANSAARIHIQTLDDLQRYFSTDTLASMFGVISSIMAIILVWQITKAQKLRSKS